MRLPRHFNRALPTKDTIRPGEAAAAEYARGQTAVAIADAGATAINAKIRLDRELEAREDNNTIDSIETDTKARLKAWETDPRYEMDTQEDGTPTPDVMRADAESLYETMIGRAAEIKNPIRRAEFERAMTESLQVIDADVENAIVKRRMGIIKKGMLNESVAAAEIRDYDRARELVNKTSSEFQDIADKQDELLTAIDELEIEHRASDLAQTADDAYAVSWERGEAFMDSVMRSDEEARDAAVAKIGQVRTQWNKTYQQERQKREAMAIRSYGSDERAISRGELTSIDEIEANRDAGRYGLPNTPGSEAKANQLIAHLAKASERKAAQYDVAATIEAGDFIVDNATNRKALDRYIQSLLEDAPEEEHAQIIADTFRVAGTVSESFKQGLNTSAKSEAALANWLPLYRELTEDQDRVPNMHLSRESKIMLEAGARLMQANQTAEEAAETAWKQRHITDTQRTVRDQEWKDDVSRSAESEYKEFVDSDYFEEPGWGDSDARAEMRAEYLAVYRETFYAIGDAEVARSITEDTLKRSWVATNLNDPSGEEYVIEKWGIPGDSRAVREKILDNVEGAERNDVELRIIGMEGQNRIVVPHVNGRVLMDDDYQVQEFVLSPDEITQSVQEFGKSEAWRSRMRKIDNKIHNLELLINGPYASERSIAKREAQIEELRQERAELEKRLGD